MNLLLVLFVVASVVFIGLEIFLFSFLKNKYLIKKYSYFNESDYPKYICQSDEKLNTLNVLQVLSQNYLSFSANVLLIFRTAMMQYLFNPRFVVEDVYPTMQEIYHIKYQKTPIFKDTLSPKILLEMVSKQDIGQYTHYYAAFIKVRLTNIILLMGVLLFILFGMSESHFLLSLLLVTYLLYNIVSIFFLINKQSAHKGLYEQIKLKTSVDKLSESILLVYRTLSKEADSSIQLIPEDIFIEWLRFLMEDKEVEAQRERVIPILKSIADTLTLYSLKQTDKEQVYSEITWFNDKMKTIFHLGQ